MTTITLDNQRCSGCGTCAAVCPYFILIKTGSQKTASVDPHRAGACVRCGHCGAACPEGAITITYPDAGWIPADDTTGFAQPHVIGKHAMSRRSVRDFLPDQVPEETLRQVLGIVRYAPSGMNGQPVHWTVMTQPEMIRDLAGTIIVWARSTAENEPDHPLAPILPMIIRAWENGADPVCHHAPVLVLAHGNRLRPDISTDAVIALAHLDFIAPSFGLGTCWAGFVQIAAAASPDVARSLNLPDGHALQHAMLAGFPRYRFHRIPKRDVLRVTFR